MVVVGFVRSTGTVNVAGEVVSHNRLCDARAQWACVSSGYITPPIYLAHYNSNSQALPKLRLKPLA